jgi:lysozyme
MNRYSVATLSLSAAALVGMLVVEGYTDRAIVPIKGDVPTIGFGTTEGVKLGDKTTVEKSLVRALGDVQKFEGALKQCVKVPLSQNEYDAYIHFSYNVGSGAFCSSRMVRKLNAGDYAGACNEFDRWTYFQGRDCKLPENRCGGLAKRRAQEKKLCLGE